MGTGTAGNDSRALITPKRAALLTILGVAVIAGALLFPFASQAHDASDFFIFSKAAHGTFAEATCDGSNDKQADVSGSTNVVRGRIHSNADFAASGSSIIFGSAITYGSNPGSCQSQADPANTYPPGSPSNISGQPSGVGADGWPGDLGTYLNADGLTFGNTITQVLPGASCMPGTSLTNSGDLTLTAAHNGQVVCNGTGKVQLNASGANAANPLVISVTIVSHGAIEISGQHVRLRPVSHGVLAWTDQNSATNDVSIKLAGSNFDVVEKSIFFTPRSGQDISGSEGSELCIQHIGQGRIKVAGSKSEFGPGSCGPPALPQVSVDKTPDSETVNAGQPATFAMTATNNGPGAATITLNDPLPLGSGGLTWVEFTDPSNSCTVSTQPPQQQTLSCSFTNVPANESRTVSVRTQTDQADCATLNNTATVSSTGDNTPTDNTNSGAITIACPDVSVLKTGNGTVTVPGAAQFTMVITNNGPGAASGVGLTDTLPGTGWTIQQPDRRELCDQRRALPRLHGDLAADVGRDLHGRRPARDRRTGGLRADAEHGHGLDDRRHECGQQLVDRDRHGQLSRHPGRENGQRPDHGR